MQNAVTMFCAICGGGEVAQRIEAARALCYKGAFKLCYY
jgi:hypothetical protein